MKTDLENKCEELARLAHLGQVRKMGEDCGKSYADTHLRRVAFYLSIISDDLACVGWLHDIIEDTKITANDLRQFGIPQSIIEIVECLSKKEGENYLDFILRIKQNPRAITVKIKDIEDNMSSLNEGSLKDKYRMALYILGKNE